jgi:hypothetical protein
MILQHPRDGHLAWIQANLRARTESTMDAYSIWITTREQSGSRCRANRLGYMKISESNTGSGKRVNVRRFVTACALATQVGVPLVIGENDYHVWPTSFITLHPECETDA